MLHWLNSIASAQKHWQNLGYQIFTNLPHHSTTCLNHMRHWFVDCISHSSNRSKSVTTLDRPTKKIPYSISWFSQCSVASQEHWKNLGYQISTNLPHNSTMQHWFVDCISYSSNRSKSVTTLDRPLKTRPLKTYAISWFCQCSVASQEHWQNLLYQISTNLPHNSTMQHWFVDCISYSSNRSKSVTTLDRPTKKFPTRSHDFPNALWHHRNIEKILDIKSLQICHITQPCNTDLWIASPILQSGQSQSQPLIAH